jgi:hypothetical protein
MNTKTMPVDVLRARLATLNKEKLDMELDLERDLEETKARIDYLIEDETYRADQDFWRSEISKFEFCIEEIERLIKLIK